MKHLLISLILVLALFLSPNAVAEQAPAVTLTILETTGAEGSFVRYPSLSGGDEAQAPILEKISQAIRQTARIDEYLLLLQTVAPGGSGLQMTCEYALGDRYLSVLLSAEGKMLTGRPSQIYYPMTFDLTTGEQTPFDALFTDADAARAEIEQIIAENIEPTLSTYLENTGLFPVPFDRFFLSGRRDITFYYENSALSFLSGRSGAVSLQYHELAGVLDRSDAAPASDVLSPTDDLMAEAKNGSLAGLARPIKIGDSLESVLNAYRASSDSGFYPGGAYYETEDARLRGTYVIADEAETTVTGIICTRYDASDLVTGVTTREEWRKNLGEPSMTMPLSGAAAQSYLLCDGESDYYLLGERQLVLHADANGLLYAVILK